MENPVGILLEIIGMVLHDSSLCPVTYASSMAQRPTAGLVVIDDGFEILLVLWKLQSRSRNISSFNLLILLLSGASCCEDIWAKDREKTSQSMRRE